MDYWAGAGLGGIRRGTVSTSYTSYTSYTMYNIHLIRLMYNIHLIRLIPLYDIRIVLFSVQCEASQVCTTLKSKMQTKKHTGQNSDWCCCVLHEGSVHCSTAVHCSTLGSVAV